MNLKRLKRWWYRRRGSQLSYQSIRLLCEDTNVPMISPFVPEKQVVNGKSYGLSGASYDCRIDHDLTLGVNPAHIIAEHLIGGGEMDDLVLLTDLAANPPMSALAYTVEDFWMPNDVAGAVCDKSTYARVFVSAFNTFFDPGFHGNATLELVNLGTKPVVYKAGDPVCQFIFHWLDRPTSHPYSGKYQHQTKQAHGPRLERVPTPEEFVTDELIAKAMQAIAEDDERALNEPGVGRPLGIASLPGIQCDHKHYNPAKDGRRCTCGTLMYDPGD